MQLFKNFWTTTEGEILQCLREMSNPHVTFVAAQRTSMLNATATIQQQQLQSASYVRIALAIVFTICMAFM